MNYRQLQLVLGLLLLFLVTGCNKHSSRVDVVELYRHPGALWLSWTPRERDNFVYGYIVGYSSGMNEACLAADDLFEKDVKHVIGHDDVQSTFPSTRCRASVAPYSNVRVSTSSAPDFTAYTNVLTEFYTKHPEYRDMLPSQLMGYLSGGNKVTADACIRN